MRFAHFRVPERAFAEGVNAKTSAAVKTTRKVKGLRGVYSLCAGVRGNAICARLVKEPWKVVG